MCYVKKKTLLLAWNWRKVSSFRALIKWTRTSCNAGWLSHLKFGGLHKCIKAGHFSRNFAAKWATDFPGNIFQNDLGWLRFLRFYVNSFYRKYFYGLFVLWSKAEKLPFSSIPKTEIDQLNLFFCTSIWMIFSPGIVAKTYFCHFHLCVKDCAIKLLIYQLMSFFNPL